MYPVMFLLGYAVSAATFAPRSSAPCAPVPAERTVGFDGTQGIVVTLSAELPLPEFVDSTFEPFEDVFGRPRSSEPLGGSPGPFMPYDWLDPAVGA